VWTSLRFNATGGTMAIIVPAPPGTSLDFSSDAWFEALEVATAPRVFPPPDVSPYCSGESGPASVFEIDGQVNHTASLAPEDVAVLADVPAVSAWAAGGGLVIPAQLVTALDALQGMSFVAVRFAAPAGPGVTPTLRLAMSGVSPVLPLALTQAGGSDLRVTAWMIGQGEAGLVDGVPVAISPSSIAWNAAAQATNYGDLGSAALDSGPDTFLVEAASHDALVQNVSIAQGTAFIDGVVTTFFDRAAAYGDGAFDASSCISAATPALESSAVVAAVCPRAALGVIAPAPTCTESTAPGQIDPQVLLCGSGADDLALALSGLTPALTWVTRQSLLIPASSHGADAPLDFLSAAPVSPLVYAATVDVSGCGDAGTMTGSSSSSGSGSSSGTSSGSSMSTSSGMSSSGHTSPSFEVGSFPGVAGDVVDAIPDDVNCSCSGPGATTDEDDADTSSSGDSCSSGGDSGSDGGSGDSCSSGGDSGSDGGSGDSCSSGSGSDDSSSSCSGDSGGGGDSCSGDGGGSDFNCSTAGRRRVHGPKLSILLMMAIAVIAPLRRRGRRTRAR
jgi:hypothetical protein